ncbi:MAG: hypothetical protein ABI758_01790 [Candidatus Woesebacteria bacterium]
MSKFVPGQFRQKLQEKIKANPLPDGEELRPFAIKNLDPNTFANTPSQYAGNEAAKLNQSVSAPQGTASLPKDSIMNKPVHERMKAFITEQYGKK